MRFFDTNVLVYAQDALDPAKQSTARKLVQEAIGASEFTISTQVMQEFYAVAARRQLLSPTQASTLVQAWAENEVVSSTPELVLRAFALQQSSQLSVWDALIVQAALDAGCTTLYTEDMQHGMRFGNLELVNPFLVPAAVHEPPAPYRAAKRRAVAKATRS
ncbi:PIN domain-containing protein [Ramlibacter sp. WS9]|uniref:PIN domain-containing protein n=1 Tax=Ramlibacter sp. WS9 TaxID=1882741 RepID=UPI0011430CA9|nr:PIN domain-containing protein [Ramlibacter sp. WS9]ROZ72445.1 PIN domain-containing protein [Ramlibacter sp. WS9]